MSSYEKKQFINIQHLHECKEGDIIITRHIDGTYYIGKVNRPWKYIGKKKYEYYDVVNNVGMIWYNPIKSSKSLGSKYFNAFLP